ncbi:MAG: YgiT-type zinc finger protein [Pseudobdellovibrio sp.]
MAKSKTDKPKSNCPSCDKGVLVLKSVVRKLELDGAPTIEADVDAEVCNHCDEIYISDKNISEANKLFLEKILNIFLKNPSELPGKVATWIRKEISLSARDLAVKSGLKESTLSHAHSNNSFLDRFAATVLLLMANDKLKGTNLGASAIAKLSNLEDFWGHTVPTADIVKQIKDKTEVVSMRWATVKVEKNGSRRRAVAERQQVQPITLFPTQGILKSNPYRYTSKKTSHKR